MSNLVRGVVLALALVPSVGNAGYKGAFIGSFAPIRSSVCHSNNPFTVGTQYRDGYTANGVTPDSFSMLMRWQDFAKGTVSYDLGTFTGVHNVPQSNQIGFIPESASAGTPGVQVNCHDIGMFLNSWATPHRPIVGGGYNNMWGYAWSPGNRVTPFFHNGYYSHLVLQADMGVNDYNSYVPGTGWGTPAGGSAQLAFFAYVRDKSPGRGHLPPIAIIGGAFDTEWLIGTATTGAVSFDYNANQSAAAASAYPLWFPAGPGGDGVWYGSGPISIQLNNTQTLVDTYHTVGENAGPMTPLSYGGSPPMKFFRVHISPKNLVEIVNRINNLTCPRPLPDGRACLPRGYSANPVDYELEYAGVIAETTVRDTAYDVSASNWVVGDATKKQVIFGARVYAMEVHRGTPLSLPPYGVFDVGDINGVYGWACDVDTPGSPVEVVVHDQFGYLGTAVTGLYRPDVSNAGLCSGRQYSGYTFRLRDATRNLYDGQTHSLSLYVKDTTSGSEVPLAHSPVSINYTNEVPFGWLDSANAQYVHGWACDPNSTATGLKVEIRDSVLGTIGSMTADGYRPDLVPVCGGNGYHAYLFNWAQATVNVRDNQYHQISVFAEDAQTGAWTQMLGSPQTVFIPAP